MDGLSTEMDRSFWGGVCESELQHSDEGGR